MQTNNRYDHKKHICHPCLHDFNFIDVLQSHTKDCQGIKENPHLNVIPEQDTINRRFEHHNSQMHIVYVDLEAMNGQVKDHSCSLCKSSLHTTANQVKCGFCYMGTLTPRMACSCDTAWAVYRTNTYKNSLNLPGWLGLSCRVVSGGVLHSERDLYVWCPMLSWSRNKTSAYRPGSLHWGFGAKQRRTIRVGYDR
ncbi:hypothetical protein CHS0354_013796 [Potamilus streckersoni]|uniref:Uncharacterized protein n=1 Tax=Potamilus streckersoni TaxID=2493646 RepID=A0AAE0SGR9_9BIVA|nr:hypothetical protein CHS0354_013796 [Potamilus streckersoni]